MEKLKIYAATLEETAERQIGDTVDIIDTIKPIYNFKAKTPEKPDWKALRHKLPKEGE